MIAKVELMSNEDFSQLMTKLKQNMDEQKKDKNSDLSYRMSWLSGYLFGGEKYYSSSQLRELFNLAY